MAQAIEFPYGASYSPLIFAETDWDRDLAQMQAASINLIRIGDVHGSWDRIEPRQGELQLDRIQRFYSAARRYGIAIMLSTGASSPPLWLATRFPDVSVLSSRGERYPLGASYHWACVHHPGYRQAAESYLRRMAEFAMLQPNHFGWQISNEIGFPFLPARERNELGLYCYCPSCQAEFRQWVQAKYGNLEALTEAWSWGTTNLVYNDWAEVRAPESKPASWSGVTRWLDWRLFWQAAFARFAGWQHQLIREVDPHHPTSVNTFNFKGFDRFGTFMGLDQWQIAKQVDHIGYDLYPGSGDKLKSRPEHNSIFLDHGRSVAQSVGRDFWIHELESGPISGWVLGPDHNTDAVDIFNNTIECLGHNAKLIMFMPWREWDYQPLRWGALVDLDGNSTPLLAAASTLGKFIRENSAFLLTAQTRRAEVALLESKPNAIFFRGTDQEEVLFDAQRGAYRAFWEQGYGVDFITPDQCSLEKLAGYQYVVLPLMGLVSTQVASVLEAYVAGGGILVGFARCGTLDERGWSHHQLPIEGLRQAFGLRRVSADASGEYPIELNGRTFHAYMNRDIVEPEAETEVLARFDDGLPAVTLCRHGQGAGVYLATQADGGAVHGDGGLLSEILTRLRTRLGRVPFLQVECLTNRAGGIDPHLLEEDQRSMLLFSNYCESSLDGTVHLALGDRQPDRVRQVFPTNEAVEWVISGGELIIHKNFAAKEVHILDITWK